MELKFHKFWFIWKMGFEGNFCEAKVPGPRGETFLSLYDKKVSKEKKSHLLRLRFAEANLWRDAVRQ